MDIIPVSKDNFDQFFNLIIALADYEHLEPPTPEAKERMFKHAFETPPKFEAHLGVVDGKPIGYTITFYTYSTFLAKLTMYLEDFFILEEHRRSGYGQIMFDAVVQRAKDNDCGRMEWAVLDWNEMAINFYKKNGAEPQTTWTPYRIVF